MVRYEVRVLVRADLQPAFETYMADKHLPEILATGCFASIRFERSEDGGFRSCYEAASEADLERYLAEHTLRFREDFLAHFPEGCEVRREVWAELKKPLQPAG